MADYRISRQARQQIVDIGVFSAQRFGAYQAKAYHSGLERTFQLLADFPGIGVDASEILSGVRRFRFQSHLIYYSESPDGVLIRALFHVAQDVRKNMFE